MVGEVERGLQGKVNGEPRHHAAALGVHGQRVGTQFGARVEHGFEVAGEAVADGSIARAERQPRVPGVVFVL